MLVAWLAVAQAQDLTLSFPQLRPGQQVTFTIGGLNQGESATLVRANAVGPGLCPASLGGMCLDITGSPAIVASAVANASGIARITLTVPANVPNGLDAALQAVAVRGVGGVDSVKSRAVGTTVTTGAVCPVYADPTVLPGGDGSAGQPYPSIGYAMAFRDPSCTDVLLYPGTYDETIDYGGVDLSISSLEGRDATILSSSVGGTLVRIDSGETSAAMLQGVTLHCELNPWSQAIYLDASSPVLDDLVIEGCGGTFGAVRMGGSGSAHLTNSLITGNIDTAIVVPSGTHVISGNTISANGNVGAGGTTGAALHISGGAPLVEGNRIENNLGSAEPVVYLSNATASIVNNLFLTNSGHSTIYAYYDSGSDIVNNTFVANDGRGIYFYYASGTNFVNNIVSNQASYAAYSAGGTWVYYNNDAYPAQYGGSMGTPTGSNGNIAVDPRFVGGGDYNLVWGSACIDSGWDGSGYGVTTDILGRSRPRGLGYDLGAYETW